ncbi:MAG: leucine-rich repeat protein [Clostridia bacterium]|nr:leucine-rich repeat protein [Clostridia bacterium]
MTNLNHAQAATLSLTLDKDTVNIGDTITLTYTISTSATNISVPIRQVIFYKDENNVERSVIKEITLTDAAGTLSFTPKYGYRVLFGHYDGYFYDVSDSASIKGEAIAEPISIRITPAADRINWGETAVFTYEVTGGDRTLQSIAATPYVGYFTTWGTSSVVRQSQLEKISLFEKSGQFEISLTDYDIYDPSQTGGKYAEFVMLNICAEDSSGYAEVESEGSVTDADGKEHNLEYPGIVIIGVPEEAPEEETTEGVSGDWQYELTNGEVEIVGYNGKSPALTIPSEIEGYPVTSIDDQAFDESYVIPDESGKLFFIESVDMPDSITSIGSGTFFFCEYLSSVRLSSQLKQIPYVAFFGCSNLRSIAIPSSVTTIGEKAFESSGLQSVTIPNGVTSIGSRCFANCTKLTSVTLSSSLWEIPESCFEGCTSLTTITIPPNVESVGTAAFNDCTGLQTIYAPVSLKPLASSALINCSAEIIYYDETDRIAGDATADGVVDMRDALRVLRHLAGWDVVINESNADCNGDGTIDMRDALRLLRHLAGWEVELV